MCSRLSSLVSYQCRRQNLKSTLNLPQPLGLLPQPIRAFSLEHFDIDKTRRMNRFLYFLLGFDGASKEKTLNPKPEVVSVVLAFSCLCRPCGPVLSGIMFRSRASGCLVLGSVFRIPVHLPVYAMNWLAASRHVRRILHVRVLETPEPLGPAETHDLQAQLSLTWSADGTAEITATNLAGAGMSCWKGHPSQDLRMITRALRVTALVLTRMTTAVIVPQNTFC